VTLQVLQFESQDSHILDVFKKNPVSH
jgi:hypothetical protein